MPRLRLLIWFALITSMATYETTFARSAYIEKGEGDGALHAFVEMDDSNQLRLELYDCRRGRGGLDIRLGIYRGNTLAPEIENALAGQEPETKSLYLCLNNICEERTWEFLESSYSGGLLFSKMKIEQRRAKIHSLRILFPNVRQTFEYTGDIESILKRICR